MREISGRSVSRFAVLKPSDDLHREAGVLVSRMFPAAATYSCLFLSRSRISVSNCTSAGGARCGRFLFLFLLQFAQQADQQEDRERDNQKVQRGLQKVAVVDRDGRLYDLASRRENRFFERDLEIGEVDSPDQQSDRRHDDVGYQRRNRFCRTRRR